MFRRSLLMQTALLLAVLPGARATAQADERWPKEPVRRIETAAGQKDTRAIRPVGCLVFSPDSKVLAYSAADLRLFDLAAGKEIRRLDRRVWWPTSMAFCQGGESLVFIDRGKTVYTWKWKSDPEPTKFYDHPKDGLFCLAVHESGDAIAVTDLGNNDQTYLWRKDKEKATLSGCRSSPLRFVLDGKALLSGHAVIDLASLKELSRIQDKDYQNALDSDVLIPIYAIPTADGRSLLLHAGSKVRFWNLADGKVQREWSFAAKDFAESGFLQNSRMTLSPDAGRLAVASDEKAVRFYDARTGKLLTRLQADQGKHVFSLAISPNGRLLASGGEDGTILLWTVPPD